MKITVDTDAGSVVLEDGSQRKTLPLNSPEAYASVSAAWLRCGWDTKYVYTFSWLGRPIIQLPDDVLRIQEVIHQVKPDVIIETGVAHGGSLILYATLCKAMEKGRVIGIDIEIRPHNRNAIEAHLLAPLITLVEGSSIDAAVVSKVKELVKSDERVLVILDSNHSKAHVLSELNAYADLVSKDSYVVACDGIMRDLASAPRGAADWNWNNPCSAVEEFLERRADFVLEQPHWPFNESEGLKDNVTYWPNAWLRRR